jgi:preprotein translocase subunit SecG
MTRNGLEGVTSTFAVATSQAPRRSGSVDFLSIALIVLAVWFAIVVVALALARAAGRAEADNERPHDIASRGDRRASDASPLDALADEIIRARPPSANRERLGGGAVRARRSARLGSKKSSRRDGKPHRIER